LSFACLRVSKRSIKLILKLRVQAIIQTQLNKQLIFIDTTDSSKHYGRFSEKGTHKTGIEDIYIHQRDRRKKFI
jgi:hypothetical protein